MPLASQQQANDYSFKIPWLQKLTSQQDNGDRKLKVSGLTVGARNPTLILDLVTNGCKI